MAQKKAKKPVDKIQVLVTDRDEAPRDKAILKTPEGEPDVQFVRGRWWTQVLVRSARSFLQNFIGYLIGAGFGVGVAEAAEVVAAKAGVTIPPEVKTWGTLFLSAFFAALSPTIVCMAQNALEILTKVDTTAPKLRA